MAFKMKGSPVKMGGIKGTSGHVSALKQHAEASALKQAEASALKEGTDWWDKVKAAGGALYDNVGKVHGHGNSNSFSSNVAKSYGKKKKEYRKEAKESSNKMKSPMEQKKKLNLKTIKEGFKGTDTEKVVKGVKKIAGKVKKFRKSLKPTSKTKVKSESTEGKIKRYDDGSKRTDYNTTVTASTERNKKKLFGGNKKTTTSNSRNYDEQGYTETDGNMYDKDGKLTTSPQERSVEDQSKRKQGNTTVTHTRNKRRGGGKKKEVVIDQETGKKTVTRYKKDGTVKSTKVKKGDHSTYSSGSNKKALRNEDVGDGFQYKKKRS